MTIDVQNDLPLEEYPLSKAVVGIIYPPADIRNVVDKTAAFVAKNGQAFEEKIRQKEINNAKFVFLDPNHAFHNYYQRRIKDILEGGVVPAPIVTSQKPVHEQFKVPEKVVLTNPPPEREFVVDPLSISKYDLDLVHLTAHFVARNGRQFLNNIMAGESKNMEFDFLRPQHNLFKCFTKVVEQYNKMMLPPKDLVPNLKKEVEDKEFFKNDIKYHLAWMKQEHLHKKKGEDEKEKERIAYAQVNWHAFKLVECVDPFGSFNLPPMIRPEQVGYRLIDEQRCRAPLESVPSDEPTKPLAEANDINKTYAFDNNSDRGVDTNVQDMDEDSEEEEVEQEKVIPPLPTEASGLLGTEKIIIRTDYDPKERRNVEKPKQELLKCPITGELVPDHKFEKHMKINLLDPKWVENRNRNIKEKLEQDAIYADGNAIVKNVVGLAKKRSDIFGMEEVEIGSTIEEEEAKKINPSAIWDGHSSSSEKVTKIARQNFTIQDQIANIHKSKGLVHDEEKEKIGPSVNPPVFSYQQRQPEVNHSRSMQNVTVPFRPPVLPIPSIPGPTGHCLFPPRPMGVMPQPHIPVGQGFVNHVPQVPMGHYMPNAIIPHALGLTPDVYCDPPCKRVKMEEGLIPEHEFLARHQGLVEFKVQAPIVEKSDWKLNGQLLSVTLPLSDSVSVLKAKVFEAFGMPAGKQKFQLNGLFLKDQNSLAYYNIGPNSIVALQVKERGGKK